MRLSERVMKRTLLSLAVVLSMTNAVWADPLSTEQQRQMRNANRKIWFGVVMMAGGAVIAPLTALATEANGKGQTMKAGVGLMIAGSAVIWWGASERRRTLDPQITVGVSLGRGNAVFVRRTW